MSSSTRFTVVLLTTAGLLAAGLYLLQNGDQRVDASLTVADALGSDTTGYERAVEVRPFVFPEDHGPHPGFKTEWWYLTGNLTDPSEQPFGYQLTIFRIALTPPDSGSIPAASPDWSTNQVYMGHLAVTDGAEASFHAFERFSRGSAGLAGAQASPFRVWLEDWSMTGRGESLFPLELTASGSSAGIDLTLRPIKGRILQGDRGLDRKGSGRGNASYYYSYPRLATQGTITSDGTSYDVQGLSWMDREWSTSALGEDQVGWDWFALHLSNDLDLMYYQLREADGTAGPYTSGLVVDSSGGAAPIQRAEVTLEVLDRWRSSTTGIEYPSGWRMQIPEREIDLTIRPLIQGQELDVSVRYWEGAVVIEGSVGSEAVSGRGYVELTGYGDDLKGSESGVPY